MNDIRPTQNNTQYINAILSVMCLMMISQTAFTKSNELVVNQIEQDALKVIECVDLQAYHDSFYELDMKFESCIQQVIPSLDIESKDESSSNYYDALNKHITKDESFKNTIKTIEAREFSTINDPLYDMGADYKPIEDRLIGSYTIPSNGSSPEGHAGIILLPNRKYAIYSFGYIEGGDWRVVDGKYLHLIPYRMTQPYYVYGRHNSDLGQESKIRFVSDDFDNQTLVGYDNKPAKLPLLTPVFNVDANCYDWPYEAVYPDTYQYLTLAYNPDYENKGVNEIAMHTFSNQQQFNDLYVLSFRKMNERKTTKLIIKNGNLYQNLFSQLEQLYKSELPESGSEDAQFMKYVGTEPTITESLFYNPAGKEIHEANIEDSIVTNNYTYNEKLKAMVADNTCSDEYCPPADDYNNNDIFYEYKLLDTISQNKRAFQLQPKSLIHAECQKTERWDNS